MRMPRSLCLAVAAIALPFGLSAGPAPVLGISPSNPRLFLWPTNVPSFALETKTNCDAGTPWLLWPQKPSVAGSNYVITNLFSGGSRFFRLSNWPQQHCANQMKQIGLAFRVWMLGSNDQFPFQVSTNLGGTMELRSIGADGFDANAFLHFQVISNELGTAALFVCPGDIGRVAVTNFADLQPQNVTYWLRTSADVTDFNPDAVLAVCPIDGNTLYCNGAVTNGVKY